MSRDSSEPKQDVSIKAKAGSEDRTSRENYAAAWESHREKLQRWQSSYFIFYHLSDEFLSPNLFKIPFSIWFDILG